MSETRDNLPSPQDRPEADVIIFDGSCIFCRRQVARLHWADWWRQLAFVPLQDPLVAERFPDLSQEQLYAKVWLVARDGRRFGGADAIRRLSGKLPLLFLLFPLMHLPGSRRFWHWGYAQIAKRRYRLGGRDCESGACGVPWAADSISRPDAKVADQGSGEAKDRDQEQPV